MSALSTATSVKPIPPAGSTHPGASVPPTRHGRFRGSPHPIISSGTIPVTGPSAGITPDTVPASTYSNPKLVLEWEWPNSSSDTLTSAATCAGVTHSTLLRDSHRAPRGPTLPTLQLSPSPSGIWSPLTTVAVPPDVAPLLALSPSTAASMR